jgi:hypothetical protein
MESLNETETRSFYDITIMIVSARKVLMKEIQARVETSRMNVGLHDLPWQPYHRLYVIHADNPINGQSIARPDCRVLLLTA